MRKIAWPSEDVIEVIFQPESFIAIGSEEPQALEWGRGKRAWLVSGIGNNPSFRRLAESVGMKIVGETAFEDHHRYAHTEVREICTHMQRAGSDIVLTTEKDGGKLSSFLGPNDSWWMLRLRTDVVRGEHRLHRLIDEPLPQGEQPSEARA